MLQALNAIVTLLIHLIHLVWIDRRSDVILNMSSPPAGIRLPLKQREPWGKICSLDWWRRVVTWSLTIVIVYIL